MPLPRTDAFIDETKWEANATLYKFVWKTETYHRKLKNTRFNHTKKELFKPLFFDQVFKQPFIPLKILSLRYPP